MNLSKYFILSSAVLSSSAIAQSDMQPAPPNPQTEAVTRNDAPGVGFLTRRYGLSVGDAREQLGLQQEISDLAARLTNDEPERFGGIFVEHKPPFKIVVLLTDADTRKDFKDQLSPQLRRFVQVLPSKRSQADVRMTIDRLVGTFAAARMGAAVGFDPKSQKFRVTVETDTKRPELERLLPNDLKQDVQFRVARLPRDAQAGYVSGDYTYGGWTLYSATNAPACTTGYVVRLSDARLGVTTAAHCTGTLKIWTNGHYVTLAASPVTQGPSGLYDFKVLLTGNLTVSGAVAYVNNQPIRGFTSLVNSVSGYPNSGYFNIEDGLYRVLPNYGDVMCKSGQRTGLTCGEIVDTYYSYTTSDTGISKQGMVALGYSYERVIGFSGDSGGPVFTYPTANGTVRPAGLVVGANADGTSPCDTTVFDSCELYYMPIDRINDQQPMQIKTSTGTLNP